MKSWAWRKQGQAHTYYDRTECASASASRLLGSNWWAWEVLCGGGDEMRAHGITKTLGEAKSIAQTVWQTWSDHQGER